MRHRPAAFILLLFASLFLWMLISLLILSSMRINPLPALREAGDLALSGILRGAV